MYSYFFAICLTFRLIAISLARFPRYVGASLVILALETQNAINSSSPFVLSLSLNYWFSIGFFKK